MPIAYFILETFVLPNCYRHLFICVYMCRFRIFSGMGVREITLLTKGVSKALVTFPFSDPRIETKPMN